MKKSVLLVLVAVAFVIIFGAARARAFSGENREFTPAQRTIIEGVFPGYFTGNPENVTVSAQTLPAPQPLPPPRPVETARPAILPEVKVASVSPAVKPVAPSTPAAPNSIAKQEPPVETKSLAPPAATAEVKERYYLFDRRGHKEVGQLAQRVLRESPGGMVVQDPQDASREYEEPKARVFIERYVVPTPEMVRDSESRHIPSSSGFQIIK